MIRNAARQSLETTADFRKDTIRTIVICYANGVRSFSPGLPSRDGYPGTIPPTGLKRNAVPSPCGLTTIAGLRALAGRNHVVVRIIRTDIPWVGPAGQPRAEGRNPFGIQTPASDIERGIDFYNAIEDGVEVSNCET